MFRRGKKSTQEIDTFCYFLEENLLRLRQDLINGTYQHSGYKSFRITDTKRRDISVACIRDRIVHRLLYDYLVSVFDKNFIYDAWSCRKDKGLLAAITRTQQLLKKHKNGFVWRSDITKFFDSIDHKILKTVIRRKVKDQKALQIIDTIINSYFLKTLGTGIPIGNLTSQIFTNIYLHELDFYILHTIKPLVYVRYGDDFLLIAQDLDYLKYCKEHLTVFIDQQLKLTVHAKNNIIVPAQASVHFLGCDIYPSGRRLRKRMYNRIKQRLNFTNNSSYRALIVKHGKNKMIKWLDWSMMETLGEYL